jgi:predicted patatin/cPLA2 family phospholipase
VPIVYNKSVSVNGVEYCDGEIGHGIPLDFVLDRACTDVLLVLNSPISLMNEKHAKLERLLSGVLLRKFTPEFRTATVMRNKLYNRSLKALNVNNTVNIGIIAPTAISVSFFSRDSKTMQMVAREAEVQVQSLFYPLNRPQPTAENPPAKGVRGSSSSPCGSCSLARASTTRRPT